MSVHDDFEELRAEVDRLRAEVRELRATRSASEPLAATTGDSEVTRRSLLRLAGASAAGAGIAVAGTALMAPTPAGATTGAMMFGTSQDAELDTTILTASMDPPGATLVLNNVGDGHALRAEVSGGNAIVAQSNGDGHGVVAFTSDAVASAFDGHGAPGSTVVRAVSTGADSLGLLASAGTGVRGIGTEADGAGVHAEATGNALVAALVEPLTVNSIGVDVLSGGAGSIGVRAAGNRAPIQLVEGSLAGAPTFGDHARGELYVDNAGNLFLCTIGGNGLDSTWAKLNDQPITGGGGLTLLAAPVRVYDSRPGFPPTGIGPKTKLNPNQERDLAANANSSGVPGNAKAILMNLTVGNTVGGGFLAAFAADVEWSGSSSINWFASGQVFANGVTTALDTANTEFTVRAGGTGPTDFIVDVIGYYT